MSRGLQLLKTAFEEDEWVSILKDLHSTWGEGKLGDDSTANIGRKLDDILCFLECLDCASLKTFRKIVEIELKEAGTLTAKSHFANEHIGRTPEVFLRPPSCQTFS